jgi:hypothetical protein
VVSVWARTAAGVGGREERERVQFLDIFRYVVSDVIQYLGTNFVLPSVHDICR